MQDTPNTFDTPMADLPKAEWFAALRDIAEEEGFYTGLGPKHAAAFVEEGDTLLVTFESYQGIQTLSDAGQPLGFDLVRAMGWSHLGVISDGETWFRDENIYRFFDELTDDGFFDEFDKVIFYGAGPCGYAAAAFSVAAPGATVVAVQPQATLNPRVAGWDDRFTDLRRMDFTSRYGYAPDMVQGADHAFVIYDPQETLDAMHAALFTADNVTMLPTPFLGDTVQSDLLEMAVLYRVLAKAGTGKLDTQSFARLMRARRAHPPYLRNLLAVLDRDGRTEMAEQLCRFVVSRHNAPKFQRRLDQMEAQKAG
ncbi:phosphoadenosine phosphosulfate reductase [Primorskyibacter aestuariivivens]|uniref:phosphoadenosine phosphosulfate reductase n=1 Tax=Primorskyibacter aestuariivivens TaxID=1888912 RepID=UPI0023003D43|nr:phosphoadenosine phosphosulfate reductase [Primorskyibacter aestuariivivens]MDA7428808.1 phosphoadenosine phosphosulfate reductase [Primorskyibacter aestuariivivens]